MTKTVNPQTIESIAQQLDSGHLTATRLVEHALERVHETGGQGDRVFLEVYEQQALDAARASDLLRQSGLKRSMIEGVVISVKALFDVTGHVTTAGSVCLADRAPATHDAWVVQRLRAAGAIVLGSTNMTEFAFSGLGLNPHYGTPLGPFARHRDEATGQLTGRIPGGSSSGAAVSVSDGMAVAGIGTDTGGSVRIPAAFCGLIGFKPTAHRIPTQGMIPLSTALDSIGPIAHSVSCCAVLDQIMSGQQGHPFEAFASPELTPKSLTSLVLAIPKQLVFENADPIVTQTFMRACEVLQQSGVKIVEIDLPEFSEWFSVHAKKGLVAAQAWAWHARWVTERGHQYDPRVLSRLVGGQTVLASDYIESLALRQEWIERVKARIAPFDALVYPTVAIAAPELNPLIESDAHYNQTNALVLRNTAVINYFDGCSLSLPCHMMGQEPVGLMLSSHGGRDLSLLQTGLACEKVLNNFRLN